MSEPERTPLEIGTTDAVQEPTDDELGQLEAEYTQAALDELPADGIKLHLRQAGGVKLSQAEEIELATVMKKGRAILSGLKAESTEHELSPEEQAAVRAVKEAHDRLVRSMQPFVVFLARKRYGSGVPVEDLTQAGNIGLLRALEKFDPARGFRLSTYAGWWIGKYMREEMAATSNSVGLPSEMFDTLTTLRRVEHELQQVLDRDPTDQELADDAGISTDIVEKLRPFMRHQVRLDQTVDPDSGATISDVVGESMATSHDAAHDRATLRLALRGILFNVDERATEIVMRWAGFTTGEPETDTAIAKTMGVSRERVRQVRSKALDRLGSTSAGQALRVYLES